MATPYKDKTPEEKAQFNEYCVERWRKRKSQAVQYKGGKCERCGYNKCEGALEFHHLDPLTKDMSWNRMRLVSWEKLTAELDKCIMLCANCHREEHCGVLV